MYLFKIVLNVVYAEFERSVFDMSEWCFPFNVNTVVSSHLVDNLSSFIGYFKLKIMTISYKWLLKEVFCLWNFLLSL